MPAEYDVDHPGDTAEATRPAAVPPPPPPKSKHRIAKLALAMLVVAFCVVSTVVDYRIIAGQMRRTERSAHSVTAPFTFYEKDYAREAVSFESRGTNLVGYYYGIDKLDGSQDEGDDAGGASGGVPKGVLVFCHGIGSWHQAYLKFILGLVDDGWIVLAYDATGCGESEGDSSKSLAQSALDADAALRLVEADERFAGLPIAVAGHSWGGYAAAAVLAFGHDVVASVSLSGYNDQTAIIAEWAEQMMPTPVVWVERPFIALANRLIAGEYAGLTAVEAINGCDVPVLVTHGSADPVIHVDGAAIYAQRDRITNPNVAYLLIDDEGLNDHYSYFGSRASYEYLTKKSGELSTLNARFDADGDGMVSGDETTDAYEAQVDVIYAGIDTALANEPNPDLLAEVTAFLDEALERGRVA